MVDYVVDLFIRIPGLKADLVACVISVKEESLNSEPLVACKL